MALWIDTHCHLDAKEFETLAHTGREQGAINSDLMHDQSQLYEVNQRCCQLIQCVIPAVHVANFETVRRLAHAGGNSYALGIHPMYVKDADDEDLSRLNRALNQYRDDPRLVAVGEIGLDFFVPELRASPWLERQQHYYLEQLKLARKFDLPVLLHLRRSVDQVLKGLRDVVRTESGKQTDGARVGSAWRGIAHAFNGSEQQARAFTELGLKLGFGGAFTFERALQLRRLACNLPLDAIVLETDAPDMPPRWLYKSAVQRAAGELQGINSPAELPRIGLELATLRGISADEVAAVTSRNALTALPRLRIKKYENCQSSVFDAVDALSPSPVVSSW